MAARKLPCRAAILDGEVIVQDGRGASDFEALQAALRSKTAYLIFHAFDQTYARNLCLSAATDLRS